jgi:micrococcal nuclease
VSAGAARLATALVALVALAVLVVAVAVWTDVVESPAPSPAMEGERARVVRVVDGDTLLVEVHGRTERVRYVGIDAPELARDDAAVPAECWAAEAATIHAELVEGVELQLQRDTSDRDRFGRLLRHARIAVGDEDGRLLHVGEELVRRGAARARSYPPDTAWDARLAEAESGARSERAGLWGSC